MDSSSIDLLQEFGVGCGGGGGSSQSGMWATLKLPTQQLRWHVSPCAASMSAPVPAHLFAWITWVPAVIQVCLGPQHFGFCRVPLLWHKHPSMHEVTRQGGTPAKEGLLPPRPQTGGGVDKSQTEGFPGGAIKNLPASAGDRDLIPGP